MQGVVKSYDPGSGDGLIVRDSDLVEFELAEGQKGINAVNVKLAQ